MKFLEVVVDEFDIEMLKDNPHFNLEPKPGVSKLNNGFKAMLQTEREISYFIHILGVNSYPVSESGNYQTYLALETVSQTLKRDLVYIDSIEINSNFSGSINSLEIDIKYKDCPEEYIYIMNPKWLFLFNGFCSKDVSGTYTTGEFIFGFEKQPGNYFNMVLIKVIEA